MESSGEKKNHISVFFMVIVGPYILVTVLSMILSYLLISVLGFDPLGSFMQKVVPTLTAFLIGFLNVYWAFNMSTTENPYKYAKMVMSLICIGMLLLIISQVYVNGLEDKSIIYGKNVLSGLAAILGAIASLKILKSAIHNNQDR